MADSRYTAVLKPYYTLSEASSFLERRIIDVVRDVLKGKIKCWRNDQTVSFAAEDLLRHQGYIHLSSAHDVLRQELGFKLSRSEIRALGRESKGLELLFIKKRGKGNLVSSQTYVSQKSLEELIRQLQTGEVLPLPAAIKYFNGYLREKLKEKGYSSLPLTINLISHEKENEWRENWPRIMHPEQRKKVKSDIDDYCVSLYDPAEYLSLPEAAQLFYQQLWEAGIDLSDKITPRTLAATFKSWSRQGKLPTKIFRDPLSDQDKLYIRKDDAQYLIEQHLQARVHPKARMFNFRQLQYREMVQLVNTLRKDVEQVSGTVLPKRIFLAKSSGTYASINYKEKEKYNYGKGA